MVVVVESKMYNCLMTYIFSLSLPDEPGVLGESNFDKEIIQPKFSQERSHRTS